MFELFVGDVLDCVVCFGVVGEVDFGYVWMFVEGMVDFVVVVGYYIDYVIWEVCFLC